VTTSLTLRQAHLTEPVRSGYGLFFWLSATSRRFTCITVHRMTFPYSPLPSDLVQSGVTTSQCVSASSFRLCHIIPLCPNPSQSLCNYMSSSSSSSSLLSSFSGIASIMSSSLTPERSTIIRRRSSSNRFSTVAPRQSSLVQSCRMRG
jgi:hypothetical protein